jgi:hypothetical protein
MSQLVLGSSLKEFFRILLGEVANRQHVSLQEVTEFYVVNLLAEFAEVGKVFDKEIEGRKDTEPLAILYHRALLQDREEKIRTLRRLGDISLYTTGFFADSLKDRVIGADYYMAMGVKAYGAVAELSSASNFAAVYRELEQKFRALTEVLEEISARGLCATGPEGTMRVFESYQRAPSGHLERVLVDAGILPARKLLPN